MKWRCRLNNTELETSLYFIQTYFLLAILWYSEPWSNMWTLHYSVMAAMGERLTENALGGCLYNLVYLKIFSRYAKRKV